MGTLRWIYDATVISPLALVSFRWFSLCSCNTGAGSHHSAPSLVKMCFYCWFIFKNKIIDLSTEVKKSASCSSNFNPTWRLKAGGEGDDRGQDGWMASLTQWTRVWASSRRWWRTRRPCVSQFMGLQWVRHEWATEQQTTQWTLSTLWSWTSQSLELQEIVFV